MHKAVQKQTIKPIYFTLIIFAAIIVFIFLSVIFLSNVLNTLDGKTESLVYDTTYQKSECVNQTLKSNMETVETTAACFGDYKTGDLVLIKQRLKKITDNSSLDNIILIDEGGNTISWREDSINVSSRTYFRKALAGEANLSASIYSEPDSAYVNIYAVPIYGDYKKIIGVAAGVFLDNSIAGSLDVPLESGSYTAPGYIVDTSGNVLVSSHCGINNDRDGTALMDKFFFTSQFMEGVNPDDKATVISSFSKINCQGVVRSVVNDQTYIAYYTDLPAESELHYVVVIPAPWVYDKMNGYTDKVISMFIFFLAIILLVVFAHIYVERTNIKSLRSANNQISRIAYVDDLTGYSTWNKFAIEADRLIANEYRRYAFVSFDMDKFKAINDMYGHSEGNRILKLIADTVNRNLTDGEIFSRVNADKFYILMLYHNDEEITARLKSIIQAIEYEITDFVPVISFGIYRIFDKTLSVRKMGDLADIAKRTIKYGETSAIAFYSNSMMEQLREEKQIENQMQSALDTHEFCVYLQPKVSLSGETTLTGAEALVRWIKDGKTISPGKFIPLFEKNRFIIKLDYYVMEQVCQKIKSWEQQGMGNILISVNMSRVHLDDPTFTEKLYEICRRHQVSTSNIEIEITESAAYESMEQLTKVFKQLKDYGFHISIDDFGSGYSSLNMLKDLPADVLKIDRVFLTESGANQRANDIIAYVIQMARSLGMETICEGIETGEQADLLRRLGCDMAQGFYFAKPMPCDDFEKLLKKQKDIEHIN